MSTMHIQATTNAVCGVSINAGSRNLKIDYADLSGRENPCPVELVSMALAGCVSLTIRAVADARNFPLEHVDVNISTSPEYGRPTKTHHTIDIVLHGTLTPKERIILLRSAKACHVHKILGGENTFRFESDGKVI